MLALMKVYFKVYEIVQRIPRGKVLSYGAISKMMNARLSAQGVGWALKALPDKSSEDCPYCSKNVPWHRVVNSRGGISTIQIGSIPPGMQQGLLEAEGVKFNDEGFLDMSRYLWVGK